VLTIIMIAGTLNLREIVEIGVWSVSPWLWPSLAVAFVTFVISGIAEVNRTPFDLPEAEQEIVAGYLTEYSSIKWALFQMAEYVNMFTAAAFMSTLFLGGYKGPGVPEPSSPASRAGRSSGSSPRWPSSCSCSSGCGRRCRGSATTNSCASAGSTSSRWRSAPPC
jgi:NADH:ubiquinone oxidoreductase subunit H